MKILLDESVPRLVKSCLSSWPITTVQELGWSAIKNAELLSRAVEQEVARTKLTNDHFDRTLRTTSTLRNWNTVQKLLEMTRKERE